MISLGISRRDTRLILSGWCASAIPLDSWWGTPYYCAWEWATFIDIHLRISGDWILPTFTEPLLLEISIGFNIRNYQIAGRDDAEGHHAMHTKMTKMSMGYFKYLPPIRVLGGLRRQRGLLIWEDDYGLMKLPGQNILAKRWWFRLREIARALLQGRATAIAKLFRQNIDIS